MQDIAAAPLLLLPFVSPFSNLFQLRIASLQLFPSPFNNLLCFPPLIIRWELTKPLNLLFGTFLA